MREWKYKMLIAWCLLVFHLPQIWLMIFLVMPKTGNGGFGSFLFNACLLISWGILHSLLARETPKRVMSRLVGDDFYKVIYISIAGISECLVLYFYQPLKGVVWETSGWMYGALLVLFFMSMGAVFLFSVTLDYMEVLGIRRILNRMNHIDASQKPPALCLKGPYLYCRHPVYTATILFLWMGPVMTVTKLELAVFWTVYVIIGAVLEDKDTTKTFGSAYEEYKKQVPLLVPRLSPFHPIRNKTD